MAESLISRETPEYIMHGFNYTLPEHVRKAAARRNRSILEASKDPKKRRRINHLALFSIVIPKGQICILCEKRPATIRHHPDYTKPLEVDFLCPSCHSKEHHKARARNWL